ncbi:Nn.00g059910.m01.CDS01 [Neocucurbitaria sp. VM-36]
MEKQGVPMQQYPQSPDMTAQQQPPVYHQDPNMQYQQQQPAMYAQQPQQPMYAQQPQQYAGSPPPQQPQSGYMQPQQPGMPPQQQSGTVYQNVTPIASLGRGPAPADCPACGQRAMTNVAFETGNTTQ